MEPTYPQGPWGPYPANGGGSSTPSFGANTKIQQPNSSGTLETTWEGTAAYIDNTAGSESSKYTIQNLVAGSQVDSQVITGTGTLFPAGTAAIPGVQVGDPTTGIFKGAGGGDFIGLSLDGLLQAYARPGNFILPTQLTVNGEGGHALLGVPSTDGLVSNMTVIPFFGGDADFVIGANGALAVGAVGGFLQIPTVPGKPTGVAHLNTGKAALCYDSTNHKLAVSSTAGTWLETAALT